MPAKRERLGAVRRATALQFTALAISHMAVVDRLRQPRIHIYVRAGLAQLVEHLICNQGVHGSSP